MSPDGYTVKYTVAKFLSAEYHDDLEYDYRMRQVPLLVTPSTTTVAEEPCTTTFAPKTFDAPSTPSVRNAASTTTR